MPNRGFRRLTPLQPSAPAQAQAFHLPPMEDSDIRIVPINAAEPQSISTCLGFTPTSLL
jgi:hypothetical protein